MEKKNPSQKTGRKEDRRHQQREQEVESGARKPGEMDAPKIPEPAKPNFE
jgi:hypothetical protein